MSEHTVPAFEAAAAPTDASAADELARGGLRLTGKRIRELGRPFRTSMSATATLGLAVTVTRVAQALLIARIFDDVLHRHGMIVSSVVAIVVLSGLRVVFVWLRNRHAATSASAISETLRAQLWGRLVELGPGYLMRRRTGAVETAIVDGVERLGVYYGEFVPLAWASIVTIVALVVWVAVLDPFAALVMLAAALVVPAAPVLTARAFGEAGQQFSASLSRLASEYLDAIQGMVTLKAFNASERWGHQLAERCEDVSADATSLGGLANMHIGFVSMGMAAGTVLGVALATLRTTHHAVAGSGLIAILLLARECFRPLGELQAAFPSAYQAVAAANGVIELLDATPEVVEPARPVRIDRVTLCPSVTFDNVRFAYQADRTAALAGVSFEVAAGETVALVGSSGAGKSTLVSLLLRHFDPQSGVIRVGGHDLRELSVADTRSLVAVTFQDTYLFRRSVADNLLLACPDAGRDQIEAAARAANAHDFIVALPDGYDTVVGERGTRLSGGERQRLAIARALLADAPILVLDEPTSSVDAASEALITDAIERLTADRTTIIIAHRLSTVRRADRVIVLDRGQVVEAGPTLDLRDIDGAFAQLVETQQMSS
ncbi:MAG: ABC transporter ATP-binding protein [Acidimicrobiia bacterium]